MLWVITLILLILCIYLFVSKNREEKRIQSVNLSVEQKNKELEDRKSHLLKECSSLIDRERALNERVAFFEEQLKTQKEQISNQLKAYQEQKTADLEEWAAKAIKEYEQYNASLEQSKKLLETSYKEFENKIQNDKDVITAELSALKSSREATLQQIKREQQIKEQQDFFRIKISPEEQADINILSQIRLQLRKPEILDKLIWTTFYQKPTTAMVNNVVGSSIVCGIYKITGINSHMVYIGQSVDIGDRFKQHVKAALGATPASANKLYLHMRQEKVENFTFEVLEQCPRSELNCRERYWIDYFESDTYGLNGTRGNV